MNDFFSSLAGFDNWESSKQTDYIVYYLVKIEKLEAVTVKQIQAVATKLVIKQYKSLPQYLSNNAGKKKGKYVRVRAGGYLLERNTFNEIDKVVSNEPVKVAVSDQLTALVAQVSDPQENGFLNEALNCYKVQANRATIIMIWIVAMNHMHKYVFNNKLNEFNAAFALNPDRRISTISQLDDFSILNEDKFILLMKSANIISNDVRKLLDEKLGTRNSAAHPSGVTITGHKATEFALDIVQNVLLKY
jgi:hypothetical protein